MTTHRLHTSVHTFGLADGCPRCEEEAGDLHQLDNEMLRKLAERVLWCFAPRSRAETKAMLIMRESLGLVRRAGLLSVVPPVSGTVAESPLELEGDGNER